MYVPPAPPRHTIVTHPPDYGRHEAVSYLISEDIRANQAGCPE